MAPGVSSGKGAAGMLYFLFLLSGFGSLILEVVWTRLLLRCMGANVLSTACVLSAFMAGLALGAFVFDRRLKSGNLIRTWGLAELLCAVFAVCIPWLLSGERLIAIARLFPAESVGDPLSLVARFIVSFLILLLPSTAMGIGFPLLVRLLEPRRHSATIGGERSAKSVECLLYALNITGAMLGSLSAGFLLLPLVGIQATSWCAAAVYLFVFIATCFVSGSTNQTKVMPTLDSSHDTTSMILSIDTESDSHRNDKNESFASRSQILVGSIVALTGGTFMLLELIWSRMFASVFGSSVYSSGTVFFMVLAGLAIGAWLPTGKRLSLASILVVTAGATLCTAYGYGALPVDMIHASRVVEALHVEGLAGFVLARLMVAAPVILPAAVSSGMIFPLAINGRTKNEISCLYLFSCMGAAVGAMLAAAVVLPVLVRCSNVALSFASLCGAALFLLAALLVIGIGWGSSTRKSSLALLACCFAVAICVIVRPPSVQPNAQSAGVCYYDSHALKAPDSKLLSSDVCFYKEGLNATIAVTRAGNTIALRSNGKVEATLPIESCLLAPGCDVSTHTLLGALPVILHPDPHSALLIGYGSGITYDAMSSFGLLSEITVAELEESVLDARRVLQPYVGQYLAAPSIAPRWRINDGRYVLASSSTNWDIVVCQAAEPRTAGAADLYTCEFWQLVRQRLNSGGICAQWLQLYAMPQKQLYNVLKTFLSVFPKASLCHSSGAGEVLLLGYADTPPVDMKQVYQRISLSGHKGNALAYSAVNSSSDCMSLFKLGAHELSQLTQGSKVYSDNSSTLEFECGALLIPPEEMIVANCEATLNAKDVDATMDVAFKSDDMHGAGTQRALSELAVSLMRSASLNALGSKQDRTVAQRFAATAVTRLPCPQTLLNAKIAGVAKQPALPEPPGASTLEDQLATQTAEYLFKGSAPQPTRSQSEFSGTLSKKVDSAVVPELTSAFSLLAGWKNTDRQQLKAAQVDFTDALNLRPHWPPALLGKALAGDEQACFALVATDPWNSMAHLLVARVQAERKNYLEAVKHAIDAAVIDGNGDGFILLLAAKHPAPDYILKLFSKYAPGDARLAELKTAPGPAVLEDLVCRMENNRAEAAVSGYKKLGFPEPGGIIHLNH